MKIHPANCDKDCERCPKFKDCNGVALTDEQQRAVDFCGYFILASVALVAVYFVLAVMR